MGVLRTNGMGEGKPQKECSWCDADMRGRPMHFVNIRDEGGVLWLCDSCYVEWRQQPGHEYDYLIENLPTQLRSRICGPGEPYCPDPAIDFDHGHTNCLLMGLAAKEIERLRALVEDERLQARADGAREEWLEDR